MLTFKKHQTFRAKTPIAIKGPTFDGIAQGTAFVCIKGGKNPQLAFETPEGGRFMALSFPLNELQKIMEVIPAQDVPATLAQHVGLSQAPASAPAATSAFKKGDFVQFKEAMPLSDTTIAAGSMGRCIKGGKYPTILVRAPKGLLEIRLGTGDSELLAPAEPLVDAALVGVTHKITTYPKLSQETIALSGTITLQDGSRLTVENSGQGSPTLIRGRDASKTLDRLLDTCLIEAGMDSNITELDDLYVGYLTTSYGIETFADYVADFNQQMAELMA